MNSNSIRGRGPLALCLLVASTLAWAAPPGPPDASEATPQTMDEERQEALETEREMASASVERRIELQALMRTADRLAKQRIDAMQRDFETKRSTLDVRSRERARAALDRARGERSRFQQEMAKLDADSAAAWIDLRSGVVAAYRDLAYALSTARQEFSGPDRDASRENGRDEDER